MRVAGRWKIQEPARLHALQAHQPIQAGVAQLPADVFVTLLFRSFRQGIAAQQRLNAGSDLFVFLRKAHLLERDRLAGPRDSEALQLGGEVLIEHLADLRHPGLHGILEVIQKRLWLAVHFTTTVYPWRIWALI